MNANLSIALVLLLASMPHARSAEQTNAILETSGVKGGLIVHVGCGDGKLTATLRVNDSFIVHGIDKDVTTARQHIQSLGLYGPVSVENWSGGVLPYTDNLVNLLIAEKPGMVSRDEVMRVLAPGGVALIAGKKMVKPWTKEVDEWTHALHGPDNNPVARDAIVGPPQHLQWVCGPLWARSHDHLGTVSVVVSSGGRLFCIVDEGPIAAVALPARWFLVARDAFNGVELWRRPVEPWEHQLRGFRSGPVALSRRLVAIGNHVFVTLGYGKPLTKLDAATGQTLKTYAGTGDTLEILHDDRVLVLLLGEPLSHAVESATVARGFFVTEGKKRLMAVQADTGAVLWKKSGADVADVMPTTLAASGGRVFFQNPTSLICLDKKSGREHWRAARPVSVSRWAWSAPTLVVQDDVVLSADRGPTAELSQAPREPGKVVWGVSSSAELPPEGEVIAFSAQTGERLWSAPGRESYTSPLDIFINDGLAWWGSLMNIREPGIAEGRDLRTGKVMRTLPPDQTFYTAGMGHHRCYRNKATTRYFLLGRAGVEFVDQATGKVSPNHWVRGVCQYGVLPCNGLLYAPPHSCACFIEAKLNGFNALAPERKQKAESRKQKTERLQRGPAYGKIRNPKSEIQNPEDWPTYRHDAARSGRASTSVPVALKPAWQTELGGKLTSLVAAEGKVFVADIETHTVHALDGASGRRVWSFTAGGRVNSPPTIYRGLVLFGCVDGHVYCLRASDGALAWRFRAGPEDRRIMAHNQLESVWPVPGSVLVHNGAVYFAAGRSSFLDGGMYLFALEPFKGEILTQRNINSRDPQTGEEPQDTIQGVTMPGALPDVMSSDGSYVYLRHMRFDSDGAERPSDVTHLFSPAGFLDDSWWHRTYWIVGTRMGTGWSNWPQVGRRAPAGRLLVLDDATVYGFGRLNQYSRQGGHVGLDGDDLPWPLPTADWPSALTEYRLFACAKEPNVKVIPNLEPKPETPAKKAKKGPRPYEKTEVESTWSQPSSLWVRAMFLAGKTLFTAGPPNVFVGKKGDLAALEGRKGGSLCVHATADGKKLAEYKLDSPPVFDGMIAANNRLYISTLVGHVLCLAERK